MELRTGCDYPAGQSSAGIPRGLRAVVIGIFVNNDSPPDNLVYLEPIGKETEDADTVVGEEHWEITGMVSVGLPGWVPMAASGKKGILRISDFTVAIFVKVKAKGADGGLARLGRLIVRQAGDISGYPSAADCIVKPYGSADLRCQRTASNLCDGSLSTGCI